jgi:hypothetical protein
VTGDLYFRVSLVFDESSGSTHVVDGFDGNGLAVQRYLVGLHHFLDAGADVIHASINANLLQDLVSNQEVLD